MDEIANITAQFVKSAIIFSGNRFSKDIIDGVINPFNRSGIKLNKKSFLWCQPTFRQSRIKKDFS
jgi:hypothetical protein